MLKLNLIITLILFISFISAAQITSGESAENSGQFGETNNIEIRFGLMSKFSSDNNFSIGSITTKNGSKGLIGAVSYTRWLKNDLALTASAGVLNASADVKINIGSFTTESATIIPLLFGIKYVPFETGTSEKLRTYFTILVGPVFGNASNIIINNSVTTQSISETAFGGFAGAGLDIRLSRLFMIGIRGGYNFVSDFRERVGFEKNYSSPEFSASFGIVF